MSSLNAERFDEFYQALHGYDPFPWQRRVAAKACSGEWPDAIALPTSAGKTGCIDIAVYALACQADQPAARTAPRRIFFVVDRRIVVDQARIHATKLAGSLKDAQEGILWEVANALLALANEVRSERSRPLDVYALRGGMYRETAWARTPLQPTVIASTVDQVGSRLFFRGYGVSDSMRPIHAGLVGNDALILLDEAHCSKPFGQTINAVTKYREWTAPESSRPPFRFVQMTATPAATVASVERANADDWNNVLLNKRFNASKPAKLVVAENATGKTWKQYGPPLVASLKTQARGLMGRTMNGEQEVRAVGVIVNRVATARALAAAIRAEEAKKRATERAEVILLTGRMRPVDRDAILKLIAPLFTGSQVPLVRPTFVVATQCLEVGADLDFHALVTECASLDALRQRFGRLNRDAKVRTFAPAVIVVREDQTDDTSENAAEDPVYGASLAETWKFLRGDPAREHVDFGVAAVGTLCEGLTDKDYERLNAPTDDAPVLLPAHLDCWVQTSPIPDFDPDPARFLHGPASGIPEVQVVIRADLGNDTTVWSEIVRLCPPSSSEALPVRINLFREWLAESLPRYDESADIEGESKPEDEEAEPSVRRALRWKGAESNQTRMVTDPKDSRDIKPGDTFVVAASEANLDQLGDFLERSPDDTERPLIDHGDAAFRVARDKAVFRFTPTIIGQWPPAFRTPSVRALAELREAPEDEAEFRVLVASAVDELTTVDARGDELRPWAWLGTTAATLRTPKSRLVELHPCGGVVVTGRKRLFQYDPTFLEDDDTSSESPAGRRVTLNDHSLGVADRARQFAGGSGLPKETVDTFVAAGYWHDVGKLDRRFQAMLLGRSPRTVGNASLAKSDGLPKSRTARKDARAVHKYPKGGRHELLSAAAAERLGDDLLLHLIATHHGSARPFALPVEDATAHEAGPLSATLFGATFTLASSAQVPAVWNGTLPDRFWRIVRRFGWWGSAYLEALFRLADHAQSRAEQETTGDNTPTEWLVEWTPPTVRSQSTSQFPLLGLAGSNPLAFLAALGTLRSLADIASRADRPSWLADDVRLSWGIADYPMVAVVHLAGAVAPAEFCEALAERMAREVSAHAMNDAVAVLEDESSAQDLRRRIGTVPMGERGKLDWLAALFSDIAPKAASQLQMVRKDYLIDNLRSVLRLTDAKHLQRTLFEPWDYADALSNQSLHWDPSEDRRHAYQWHRPSGDPTRNKRGGMLGANRLAIEAWPFFASVGVGDRLRTRGFSGVRANDTFWSWPVWSLPLSADSVASLLGLPAIQDDETNAAVVRSFGVVRAFRSQRILVGKTPNLTPATAV